MTKAEQALAHFKDGFSCSQSVLSAFATELGLDTEAALKVSSGFGGGMGHMAETCGAVTGAYMVLGMKTGRTHPKDSDAKEYTYELVRDFTSRFQKRTGHVVCRDILGVDIGNPDGYKQAIKDRLFSKLCPNMVVAAAEILDEMMAEIDGANMAERRSST